MAPEAVPEKMEVIAAARLRMNSSSRSPIIRLLIDRGILTGLEAEVCDLLGRNGEGFHLHRQSGFCLVDIERKP